MGFIVYIGFAQNDEWQNWAGTYARHSQRFEAASGLPCLIIPYYQASPAFMERLAPLAVVMSGFARSFEEYPVRDLLPVVDWVRSTTVPILAICGSHQLLAFAWHSDLHTCRKLHDEPMRRLEPYEPVTNPDYHPEYFMERGFYPLSLTIQSADDPLFAGMDDRPRVYESHYCEIKKLPPGFDRIAATRECRIQVMRHKSDRILYGVQFHPEDYSERFPDGRTILENFFRIATGS